MKKLILCCAVSAALGGAVAAWLVDNRANLISSTVAQEVRAPATFRAPTTNASLVNQSLTPEELTNIHVYDRDNRGVVNVLTKIVSRDRFFMLTSESEGAGSGCVLDKQGHILTNYHVIEDANTIQVTLPGVEKPYDGELVGEDPDNDIAVLKIDAPPSELYPIPLGTSDSLHVGQRVYTLGNPFGLEGTLTTGIISNLNRTLPSRSGREMKSIIQTDAAMNPGNSGGPLLDTNGRMIGMNVAIATKTGQNAGLGFAIPINRIRQVVPQLIEHGKVTRADIGIVAVKEMDHGLQIVELNKGGPAERAGLQGWKTVRRRVTRGPLVYDIERQDPSAADVIVAIDGQPVQSAASFVDKIEEHQPGERVVLTIIRQGRQIQVPVTLGAS
ncbi:MAG TPA: trypsin-like peptidase domain-containing protein [Lacipirellulaceae bacterium]|nr:trypsin-like peptidase domain-containing protein [Lacipirellulaceae bacterium]